MRNLMAGLLVLSMVAGCGNDNNEGNNASNNTTATNNASNNGTTANNASNNGTTANNTSNNGTTANNGQSNQNNGTIPGRTEPFVTRFGYYTQEDSLTEQGVSVTIIGKTVASRAGNERTMEDADAADFEDTFMTEELITKMRDGWGCREVTAGGADMGTGDAGIVIPYFFEARIQDGDSVREVQEITGCVLDEDPAVMGVITRLDELAAKYL